VKRTLQAPALLLVGAGILRISLFGDISLRYVKEGLRPFLLVSGLVLIVLAVIGARRDGLPFRRAEAREEDTGRGPGVGEGTGHDHARGPYIAWLLLLPAVILLVVPPPALGSFSAARENPKVVGDYDHFDPLPVAGPVPLSLTEFIGRVQQDGTQNLRRRTVVLEGFVTRGKKGSWDLSRLLVSCCAADAQSLAVTVHGVKAPRADSWVVVTGTWHAYGTLGTATAALAVDATGVRSIPEPARPYRDQAPVGG
jgi:uncharacterized repeat protein (TIGR03943 family)